MSDEQAWKGPPLPFKMLSVRARNAILNEGCTTPKDVHLVFKSNPHIPNCGSRTLNEIRHYFGIRKYCPTCGQIMP